MALYSIYPPNILNRGHMLNIPERFDREDIADNVTIYKSTKKLDDDFSYSTCEGLSKTPKQLECKYLYDDEGSVLFEEITKLQEYYPTLTEDRILTSMSDKLTDMFEEGVILIELGSGSSIKTRRIIQSFLNKFGDLHYIPIDISHEILKESSKSLSTEFKNLRITAISSDYIEGLEFVSNEFSSAQKLILWLGSSVGNLDSEEVVEFFKKVQPTMTPKDKFMVGMDMKKDLDVLLKAYDDSKGVTAAFNKNILKRINESLEANFDLASFDHAARWNDSKSRVEMHLVSLKDQTVRINSLNRDFLFKKGESIHTESSHKFSEDQIQLLVGRSGLQIERQFFDEKKWFSLNIFRQI